MNTNTTVIREEKPCHINFNVTSTLHRKYNVEKYENIPCDVARNFINSLDDARPRYDLAPLHTVNYTIWDKDAKYSSKTIETPSKAVAKIDLFMKDPAFLPK